MDELQLLIDSQEELEKKGALTETGVAYLNGLRTAAKISKKSTCVHNFVSSVAYKGAQVCSKCGTYK